jgi:hypothetical protein
LLLGAGIALVCAPAYVLIVRDPIPAMTPVAGALAATG